MRLGTLNILPEEHYISWFVRSSQFQAYPDFKRFLCDIQVKSETLKSYEVINPSIINFLQYFEHKNSALEEHTLLPLWQISVAHMIDHKELFENEFLDLHYSNGEKTLFQFDRSWHSCPACRHEDVDNFGTSYWHTRHQTPSVYKCYKHGLILEKAKYPIADLRAGVLPHQINHWRKVHDSYSEELDRWQDFVLLIQEFMLTTPSLLIELRTRVTSVLGMDKVTSTQFIKHTEELTLKLEHDMSSELLAYLFTDYARPSNKGKPKVIGNLYRGINNPFKIRSPICWIFLAYWLFPDELIT